MGTYTPHPYVKRGEEVFTPLVHFQPTWAFKHHYKYGKCAKEVHTLWSAIEVDKKPTLSFALLVHLLTTWAATVSEGTSIFVRIYQKYTFAGKFWPVHMGHRYKTLFALKRKKERKKEINVEKLIWNVCFAQKVWKIFLSRGFLTWVGRVTGNDKIFLLGLIRFCLTLV